MELLDRALIAIQTTEDSFIDINNRIIENVNKRRDRLNGLNQRIFTLSRKVLALYQNNEGMRIESPADFPILSTHEVPNMHPHQSIFYDNDKDIEELYQQNPQMRMRDEMKNMP
jgi:hypothetical protein